MISRLAFLLLMSLQQRYISAQNGSFPEAMLVTNQLYGVYIVGEDIRVSCILRGQQMVCPIFELNGTIISHQRFQFFAIIHNAKKQHQGLYSCRCLTIDTWNRYRVASEVAQTFITVTDPIPTPLLITNHLENVFLQGDVISFKCGYTGGPPCNSWELYTNDTIIAKSAPSARNLMLEFQNIFDERYFHCRCTKIVKGRFISSENSNVLVITVTDPIPTPLLITNHSANVFLQGDVISFTCGYFQRPPCNSWELYRNDTIIARSAPSIRILMLQIQNKSDEGSFNCRCTKIVKGRFISSENSNILGITVIDPIPTPLLITNHSANVFLQGDVISFTCGYIGRPPCNSWELYRNDTIIAGSAPLPRNFMLQIQNKADEGSFYCRCTTIVKGRFIRSENSNILRITLTDIKSATPTIIGICCVLVFFALVAGIITAMLYNKEKLCFSKQKRNETDKPEVVGEYVVTPNSKPKSVDHTYENLAYEATESADQGSQITYATFTTEALASQYISTATVQKHPYLYSSVNF